MNHKAFAEGFTWAARFTVCALLVGVGYAIGGLRTAGLLLAGFASGVCVRRIQELLR